MLRAEAVTAGYRDRTVLENASFTVPFESRTCILGANGSGKTTLLRCLSGALRPSAGRVLVDGQPLRPDRAGLRAHRSRVQLVLQDPDDQLFSADVFADVSFGPLNQGRSEAEARAIVEKTLEALSISHLAERPTHQLSFGEKKKVAIAGAVAMGPDVLLLDEPTAGLDPAGTSELVDLLSKLDAAIVAATHDVNWAFTWADRFAIVSEGRVTEGGREMFLDEPLLRSARLEQPWQVQMLAAAGVKIGALDQLPVTAGGVVSAIRGGPIA